MGFLRTAAPQPWGRVVSSGRAARGRNTVAIGIHSGRYVGAADDGVLPSQMAGDLVTHAR